jgi:hypothetical protein
LSLPASIQAKDLVLETAKADAVWDSNTLQILGNVTGGTLISIRDKPSRKIVKGRKTQVPGKVHYHIVQDMNTALGTVQILPLKALVSNAWFNKTIAANSSGNLLAGTVTLGLGQRVFYSLSMGPAPPLSAATPVVYVGIFGATSGFEYVGCLAGNSVTGFFDVSQAEKLNVFYNNSDAVNDYQLLASWTAMSP